eukprot:gene15145-17915_t
MIAMSTTYKSGSLAGFPWWWMGCGQRKIAIAEAEERFGKLGVVIATVGEKYKHRDGGEKEPWYHRAMKSNQAVAEYIDKMYASDKEHCRVFEIIRGAHFDGENFDGCPYFDVDRAIEDIAHAVDDERWEFDKECVLTTAMDGILDFFEQEYDLKLTYADFLVTDACIAKKYSFHILLRRYRFGTPENRTDFVYRLKKFSAMAKIEAQAPPHADSNKINSSPSSPPNLLEDVDLMPSFMSVDDKTTIDFLVTHFRHSDQVLAPTRPREGRTSKRQRTRLESDNTMAVRKSLANASNILPELPTLEEYLMEPEIAEADGVDGDEALPPPHVRHRIEKQVLQLLRDKLQDESSSVNKWYTADIIGMKTGPEGRRCYKMLPPPHTPAMGLHRQNFMIFLHDGHVRYHCFCDDPDETGDTDHLGYLDMDAMWKSSGDGDEYFHVPTTDLYDAEVIDGKPRAKPIQFAEGVKAVIMREEMGTGKTHQAMQLISKYHSPRDRTWYQAWRKDNNEHVLMIFHRRSLGRALFRDSLQPMTFNYYLDLTANENISDQKRLGVCIDSLWRVQRNNWDLVLVDEVNSVLRNIGACNSNAGNSGAGKVSVWGRLVDIIKHSKRVVLMDAMADIEVAHLLRAANVSAEQTVWRNMKQTPLSTLTYQFVLGYKTTETGVSHDGFLGGPNAQEPRQLDCADSGADDDEMDVENGDMFPDDMRDEELDDADELENAPLLSESTDDDEEEEYTESPTFSPLPQAPNTTEPKKRLLNGRTDETGYIDILRMLQDENKVYIPCCEKSDMKKLLGLCKKRFPNKEFVAIHGGLTECEKNRIISEITSGACRPDALFVTPTMTAGNSIDIVHYDICGLRLNARTICAEEVMQIILRVRELGKKCVYFMCDARMRDWEEEFVFKYYRMGDKLTGRPAFLTANHPHLIVAKSLKVACAQLAFDPAKYKANTYYMQSPRAPNDWYRLSRVIKPPLMTYLEAFHKLTNPAMVFSETKRRVATEPPPSTLAEAAAAIVQEETGEYGTDAPTFDTSPGRGFFSTCDIERGLLNKDPVKRHEMWTNPSTVPFVQLLTKYEMDKNNQSVEMIPSLKRLLRKQGATILPPRIECVSEKKRDLCKQAADNRKIEMKEQWEAVRDTTTPCPQRMKQLLAQKRSGEINATESLELAKGYAIATYGDLSCATVSEQEGAEARPLPTFGKKHLDKHAQDIFRMLCAMKSPVYKTATDYCTSTKGWIA